MHSKCPPAPSLAEALTPLCFERKKVLVLGLGKSGQAAAQLLYFLNAQVYATDDALEAKNPHLEWLVLISQQKACLCMSQFEVVIVSPGISKAHPCYMAAVASCRLIIGEIELAAQFLKDKTCIGITGTNGKTTCTLFLQHLLAQAGIKALAAGNVGTPLAAIAEAFCRAQATAALPLEPGATHLIIELSSFQLETMHTPFLDIAILLNVTADHLDRYIDFEEYAATKFKIFSCVKPNGYKWIEETTFKNFSKLAPPGLYAYGYHLGNAVSTDGEFMRLNQQPEICLPLPLRQQNHDLENFMACYAAARNLGLAAESIVSAFFSFKKPPHRIEFVAEINGVNFIDDSKGTNVDAVCRAVESIPGKIILIAGGVDKGASYAPWLQPFADKVRCICAIGQAAPKIEQELSHAIPTCSFTGLAAAVLYASDIAQKGETVLLSPGCASYDLFIDYTHRGRVFKEIINQLRERQ